MNAIDIFRSTDPYEQLIQQMLVLERQPQDRLREQKATQDRLKTVMKDVDSKLSALHTLLKSFTDAISNPFDARKASFATNDYFSVSASDTAAYGSHAINVTRLASTDKRISEQQTVGSSSLENWFNSNGSQTFEIEVASPTEASPNNRVEISVTVDPVGTTNEAVLAEVATAINDAMDAAVTAGTIKKDEAAYASVVNESSTTVRLSLAAGKTGYANRVDFDDSQDDFLDMIELDRNAVASGTRGGQVVAIGSSETNSALNSQFTLNGLTMYRSSNSITDAISGLTIELKQAGSGNKDFSVVVDKDSIKAEIESFISKYNDLLVYVAGKSTIDADAGVRGDFASDSTFRSLRFDMRNDVALEVLGQASGAPKWITDIGIKIEKDGTLKLDDVDKLTAAVEDDAAAVESLFSGANGIATRLQARVDRFVGVNGIVNDRNKSLDDNIKRLDDRIADWDDRLERREGMLRQQFARLQESLAVFQGQQANMAMFFGTTGQ